MRRAKRKYDFPYSFKSFLGYLEGTGKAAHTIRGYRLDLMSFHEFLAEGAPAGREFPLDRLTPAHLERFHGVLKAAGLRSNTRRRRLMTVRRFLSYLAGRKRCHPELGKRLPTPYKVEKIPQTLAQDRLLATIRALPQGTKLEARNRVLLWTLVETGCLVSELTRVRHSSWISPGTLEITGKLGRRVSVSPELLAAAAALRAAREATSAPVFFGFNRHGSLGTAITSRGVELLVRAYAPRLLEGLTEPELELELELELTPRVLRHSAVVAWLREGRTRAEVRERLGLKSDYAFRAYEPLVAKSGAATAPRSKT
jgi:site-specific recombinase XerD